MKSKGKEYWNKGFGLIDTSGRTRDQKAKSTIALASKTIKYTVHYKAKVKRNIYKNYKNYPKENLIIITHCVGIFYCLKEYIENMPGVFICCDGLHKGKMKHYLEIMLREKYNKEKIMILDSLRKIFSKKNQADRLAYKTNKKTTDATFIIKENNIKQFLKKCVGNVEKAKRANLRFGHA